MVPNDDVSPRAAGTDVSPRVDSTDVSPRVDSVHLDAEHRFSKQSVDEVELLAGVGVAGDAHAGRTVQHLSHMRRDPEQPNLRQVHLIHRELIEELQAKGYDVHPGQLGENITTVGLDVLALPTGTRLRLGDRATITVTGLRSPCHQIDDFGRGLLAEVLGRAEDGSVVRRSGIMAVVDEGGSVRPGDPVEVTLPPPPHVPLGKV